MTEEIVNTTPEGEELSSDDKLWAALSWIPWVGWILAVVALLIEPQKNRPFVRFHAVQAIGANIILGILSMILGVTVILACIAPLLWLITIYPAIKAYQGEYLEIPWLTDFCRGQDWI